MSALAVLVALAAAAGIYHRLAERAVGPIEIGRREDRGSESWAGPAGCFLADAPAGDGGATHGRLIPYRPLRSA